MVLNMTLTEEEKRDFYLFHLGQLKMTDIANKLDISPDKAFTMYKDNIANIVKEYSEKVNISFNDATVEEPEEEEPQDEPVEEPVVKEEDDTQLSTKELFEKYPKVVQLNDYSDIVALHLTNGGAYDIFIEGDEIPADLPDVCVVGESSLKDIVSAYVLVIPKKDAKTDTVGMRHPKLIKP